MMEPAYKICVLVLLLVNYADAAAFSTVCTNDATLNSEKWCAFTDVTDTADKCNKADIVTALGGSSGTDNTNCGEIFEKFVLIGTSASGAAIPTKVQMDTLCTPANKCPEKLSKAAAQTKGCPARLVTRLSMFCTKNDADNDYLFRTLNTEPKAALTAYNGNDASKNAMQCGEAYKYAIKWYEADPDMRTGQIDGSSSNIIDYEKGKYKRDWYYAMRIACLASGTTSCLTSWTGEILFKQNLPIVGAEHPATAAGTPSVFGSFSTLLKNWEKCDANGCFMKAAGLFADYMMQAEVTSTSAIAVKDRAAQWQSFFSAASAYTKFACKKSYLGTCGAIGGDDPKTNLNKTLSDIAVMEKFAKGQPNSAAGGSTDRGIVGAADSNYTWVRLATITNKATACTAIESYNKIGSCCGAAMMKADALLGGIDLTAAHVTAVGVANNILRQPEAYCPNLVLDPYCTEGKAGDIKSVNVTAEIVGFKCDAITDSFIATFGEAMAKSLVLPLTKKAGGLAPSLDAIDFAVCGKSYKTAFVGANAVSRRRLNEASEAPRRLTATAADKFSTNITITGATADLAIITNAKTSGGTADLDLINAALKDAVIAGVSGINRVEALRTTIATHISVADIAHTALTAASISEPVAVAVSATGSPSASNAQTASFSATLLAVCLVAMGLSM